MKKLLLLSPPVTLLKADIYRNAMPAVSCARIFGPLLLILALVTIPYSRIDLSSYYRGSTADLLPHSLFQILGIAAIGLGVVYLYEVAHVKEHGKLDLVMCTGANFMPKVVRKVMLSAAMKKWCKFWKHHLAAGGLGIASGGLQVLVSLFNLCLLWVCPPPISLGHIHCCSTKTDPDNVEMLEMLDWISRSGLPWSFRGCCARSCHLYR